MILVVDQFPNGNVAFRTQALVLTGNDDIRFRRGTGTGSIARTAPRGGTQALLPTHDTRTGPIALLRGILGQILRKVHNLIKDGHGGILVGFNVAVKLGRNGTLQGNALWVHGVKVTRGR